MRDQFIVDRLQTLATFGTMHALHAVPFVLSNQLKSIDATSVDTSRWMRLFAAVVTERPASTPTKLSTSTWNAALRAATIARMPDKIKSIRNDMSLLRIEETSQ